MDFKFGPVVVILLVFFVAKISFEAATTEKEHLPQNERSAASIDQSYNDHVAKQ